MRPVGAEGGGGHKVMVTAQDRDLLGSSGVADARGFVD